MYKKIGICGVFGEGPTFSGGQPVKVKTTIRMFSDYYGEKNIVALNTANWKKHPIKMFINCLKLAAKCKCIIILPAHKGLTVFLPLFLSLQKIFQFKFIYSVIGGWLPEKALNSTKLVKQLKKVDEIWVETQTMRNELQKLGVHNTRLISNVKYLNAVAKSKIEENSNILRCCTFSRVIKEKGIEDAIKAVESLNELDNGSVILDIYGPIFDGYRNEFERIISKSSSCIQYKGCVEPTESVSILSQYDLQIFPTHYKTEGVPGSIIDSYASAVPVVSSRWNSFSDIIEENVTGLGYEMGNVEDLEKKLLELSQNRYKLIEMSKQCLELYNNRYNPKKLMEDVIGDVLWD